MSSLLYPLYTFAYCLLCGWAVALWRGTRRLGTFSLLLVLAGLLYDNLILTLGNWLSAGTLLHVLSWPRFALHQLLLPWISYAAYDQLRLEGVDWAQHPRARTGTLIFIALTTLTGVITRLLPLRLTPTVMDGVTRYVANAVKGPPLVSILSIGAVGAAGYFIWRKARSPWLLLAVVIVFIVEGFPSEALRRSVGSGLEVALMALLLGRDARLNRIRA